MPKVRTTLTIDDTLLEALQASAKLQGVSLSSLVNDWMADTLESVQYYSLRIAQERGNVQKAVRQINVGLDLMREGYEQAHQAGRAGAGKRSAAPARPSPPSCNTGGKVPNGRGKAA